jgi:hypothetical protein
LAAIILNKFATLNFVDISKEENYGIALVSSINTTDLTQGIFGLLEVMAHEVSVLTPDLWQQFDNIISSVSAVSDLLIGKFLCTIPNRVDSGGVFTAFIRRDISGTTNEFTLTATSFCCKAYCSDSLGNSHSGNHLLTIY